MNFCPRRSTTVNLSLRRRNSSFQPLGVSVGGAGGTRVQVAVEGDEGVTAHVERSIFGSCK